MLILKQSWWAKLNELWPSHVPNFEELGFKVGPSLIGYKLSFQVRLETEVLSLPKP